MSFLFSIILDSSTFTSPIKNFAPVWSQTAARCITCTVAAAHLSRLSSIPEKDYRKRTSQRCSLRSFRREKVDFTEARGKEDEDYTPDIEHLERITLPSERLLFTLLCSYYKV